MGAQWLLNSISRSQKPFDGILVGHSVNSVAFFRSATLLVLAGVVTLFTGVRSVYGIVLDPSFQLFVLHIALLNFVLALIGALPEETLDEPVDALRQSMVADAATVLSEALKTFNFGIRGYYYFVAGICLFISPYLSMLLTVIVTGILMYHQIRTPTALAITNYVEASNKLTNMTAQLRGV